MLRCVAPWLLGGMLVLPTAVRAADPAPERLPPPRELAAPVPMPPPGSIQMRANRYDVWQYYGVDRFNQWRPRVIAAPYGAFYLYDGSPYPWVLTHPLDVTPTIMGTPYR